ncbi:transglutaminase-like cysteine peptidase [Tropicimonas sp. IMCC6043]|uniref:transglutaminase-like cysteine peptidase n=1 Tax=Tropicimonas sp. IMCC6043 TaxID=2510645 RepID=UPI00101BBB2D|nr:transglutaminase-like cysteine peptidase [Tropicimonas sp. IMCC6043]RYH10194.1 hypothetical protein EU800_09940 [Tropicimonas sp. IMCC6043]
MRQGDRFATGEPRAERCRPRVRGAIAVGVALVWLATAGAATAGSFLPSQGPVAAPRGAVGLCATYRWACAGPTRTSAPELADLGALSRRINRSTHEIADEVQYRKPDVWTLPTARGGDCEDLALLKKRELVALGYDPSRLLLTTVLDRSGQSHAVLVVRTDTGDFVLDNLRDAIRPWNRTGYTFLRMQDPDAPHRWLRLNVRG